MNEFIIHNILQQLVWWFIESIHEEDEISPFCRVCFSARSLHGIIKLNTVSTGT